MIGRWFGWQIGPLISIGILVLLILGTSYILTEAFRFCDAHKPSEDYTTSYARIGVDNKLHCGFETKPELPYETTYSVYYVTKNHDYVCDFGCYNTEEDIRFIDYNVAIT